MEKQRLRGRGKRELPFQMLRFTEGMVSVPSEDGEQSEEDLIKSTRELQ